ncbi:MAG: hypothetical protein KatS3mg038_0997 [Candidatus Kapaibacterium sp.]|nr:MAG: hypothetical protein KatS3mg038_0997 [Candidatus Kapabacteria bacterium]
MHWRDQLIQLAGATPWGHATPEQALGVQFYYRHEHVLLFRSPFSAATLAVDPRLPDLASTLKPYLQWARASLYHPDDYYHTSWFIYEHTLSFIEEKLLGPCQEQLQDEDGPVTFCVMSLYASARIWEAEACANNVTLLFEDWLSNYLALERSGANVRAEDALDFAEITLRFLKQSLARTRIGEERTGTLHRELELYLSDFRNKLNARN